MKISVLITCPDCEQTIVDFHEAFVAPTFQEFVEFVSDEISVCKCCGSTRAGISELILTHGDDSFEIPLYKGPIT